MNFLIFSKKIKAKYVYISSLTALVVVAGMFFVFFESANPENNTHVVELRQEGFYPSSITIRKGDTIKFVTTRNQDFWPASDPHPTHEYLDGFDSERPVNFDESWSYTFLSAGSWPFHDHLNSSYRGEITVVASDKSSRKDEYDCDGEDAGRCFDELIKDTVHLEGIDAAYKIMSDSFEEGNLPRACHWTAHTIGEAAYDLFREGKDFPITESTSYCGYGFYHGFLESLLRENPDVEYALSFCDKVEEQLGDMGRWNCYHGIGHGFTEDPAPPETWGDFEAMIAPGVEMCERIFGDSFGNLNLCLTGVYTVPAGFADKKEFGLSYDSDDIFAVCRTQPYRYKKACYGEFAPKLDHVLNWELERLPEYIKNITDTKTRHLVIWVVPSVMAGKDVQSNGDLEKYIVACQDGFNGQEEDICLGGTMLGIMTHGQPGEQYKKILDFCASEYLTQENRTLCYKEGIRQMNRDYGSSEKMENICTQIPDKYKTYCYSPPTGSPYNDPVFDNPDGNA
ncbi:MAG: cupredoxin domain-containing protein [Candidatus Spechtbacterales bacterium]